LSAWFIRSEKSEFIREFVRCESKLSGAENFFRRRERSRKTTPNGKNRDRQRNAKFGEAIDLACAV
jgi:hypothetical protein